jgi:hypothetical protein
MFNQENQSLATQPQNNLTTKSDVGAALATRQAQEVQAAVVEREPVFEVEVE